ncbi:MAG: GNAT family N-acetyltransferase [Saprospiraceae bacterium]|nr:GNAT family N-acetyltransferase [Saprospiraceae bacterium]
MQIVRAGIQDLETLTALFEDYRVFYRQPTNWEGSRKFLAERIGGNESTIYLALDEQDKGIGFTQLYPLFSSTRIGRLWLLNDLFVKPAHRGRGISILLIERAKKLARETKALGIILETEKTNKIGNQLYPRADFILEDDTNHYFWKNE